MYASLGANFSTTSLFASMCGAARKPSGSSGPLCALRFMSAPVFTLFVKRHEGVCRISHAVDTSVSSELKAR